MIVLKHCQTLPTAKTEFAGGSGKTNQVLKLEVRKPKYFMFILVHAVKETYGFQMEFWTKLNL